MKAETMDFIERYINTVLAFQKLKDKVEELGRMIDREELNNLRFYAPYDKFKTPELKGAIETDELRVLFNLEPSELLTDTLIQYEHESSLKNDKHPE